MIPRIGVPRVYGSESKPLIYPGEIATAQVDGQVLRDLIVRAEAKGESSVSDVPVTGWTVEPAPGWHAGWLRWHYRLVGQWVERCIRTRA